jgi:hypothetical protein
MTINLSTPTGSIAADTEKVIVRVEQDYHPDGSISVTVHTSKWITLPDGTKQELGTWQRHSATYPSVGAMVQAAAATWAPSQEYRESLAERIQDNPLEASEAVLESYVGILNAMQSYLASQQATQSAE